MLWYNDDLGELAELAGDEHVALIKLDSYYVARTHQALEERARSNYDHPDAFDWALLNEHLAARRASWSSRGILVLHDPALRDRFDLKVFVDTDADIRFIRRLSRDVAERGRTADSIVEQYLTTVRPSHEQFIEPSKRHADVILPDGGMKAPALDVLLACVRELVRVA